MAKGKRGRKKTYWSKEDFAEQYYDKHRTKVDRVVEEYKKRHHVNTSTSNKDIFMAQVRHNVPVSNFNSTKSANEHIRKVLQVDLGTVDKDLYEAKKMVNNTKEIFGSARGVKQRIREEYVSDERDLNESDRMLGYYRVKDSEYVLAKIRTSRDKDGRPVSSYVTYRFVEVR